MSTTTLSPKKEKSIAVGFISVYILLRMVADPFFWRNISELYSYAFEAVFVIAAGFVFRKHIKLFAKLDPKDAILGMSAFVAGSLIFQCAHLIGTTVPFNFDSPYLIFLLLVLSPILEESIFRMALWQSIQSLTKNKAITLTVTTLLFSAGHFAAYWFVPEEFRTFVIFQTVYVTFLGLACGFGRMKSNAMSLPILIHFSFNLGFFVGSLF